MKAFIIVGSFLLLSGCSAFDNLVYRIDIPQGNYLEQRDIDQLRVGMTKEQVIYVIGHPVAENIYDQDVWYYVFNMNSGDSAAEDYQRKVKLSFKDGKLSTYQGDFDRPENFDTPLEQ